MTALDVLLGKCHTRIGHWLYSEHSWTAHCSAHGLIDDCGSRADAINACIAHATEYDGDQRRPTFDNTGKTTRTYRTPI